MKITVILDNIFDLANNFTTNDFNSFFHLIMNSKKVVVDGNFLLIKFTTFFCHLLQILNQKFVGGLAHVISLNLFLIIIYQPGIRKGSFIGLYISNHIFKIPGVSFTHFKYDLLGCLIISYVLLKVKNNVWIVQK